MLTVEITDREFTDIINALRKVVAPLKIMLVERMPSAG
jgi:hypothetical protein